MVSAGFDTNSTQATDRQPHPPSPLDLAIDQAAAGRKLREVLTTIRFRVVTVEQVFVGRHFP